MKRKGRYAAYIICFVFLLAGVQPVYAKTAGKPTKEFANLVVFVQFRPLDADDPATNFMNTITPANRTYTDKAVDIYLSKDSPKSLENYLTAISYGQFHVNNCLPQYKNGEIEPFVLPSELQDDDMLIEGVIEQLSALGVAQSYNVDRNGDGIIDNLTIIAEGQSSDRNDTFYPHKANYSGNETLFGKYIRPYNIINSADALSILGQNEGVIAHEFLHSIGYPDLYKASGDDKPVGPWDIMGQTSAFVQYPLAYLRSSVSHWLTIDTVTTDQKQLALSPASSPTGNQAYILKSPLSDREFFVVEYREKSNDLHSLDYKLPGSGLIVYRINTRVKDLSNIESGKENGVTILGKMPQASSAADLFSTTFFSKEAGRTAFGSNDLNAREGTLCYADGSNSGIALRNIGHAGSTLTFDVSFADTSALPLWENVTAPISSSSAFHISTASDSKGSLYTCGSDLNWRLHCQKFNGSSWETLDTGLPAESSRNGEILVYNDTPYLFYNDSKGKLRFFKYSAGAWRDCGIVSSSTAEFYSVAAGTGGIYIGYSTGADSGPYSYHLKKYNGSALSVVRQNIVSGELANIRLAEESGVVYMGLRDYSKEQVIIKKVTSSSVTDLSPSLPRPKTFISFDVATASGVPYLSVSGDNGLSVYRFSNGTWTSDSGKLTASVSGDHRLLFDSGILYAIDSNQAKGKIQVWYKSGNSWAALGHPIDGTGSETVLSRAGSKLYAAYSDEYDGETYFTVKRIAAPKYIPPKAPPSPAMPGPIASLRMSSLTTSAITLAWNPAANASQYSIYKSTSRNGSYQLVGTVSGTRFTESGLPSGRNYYYKVRAISSSAGNTVSGPFSSILSAGTRPGKMALKLSSGKKKIALRWKKVSGADGYQIYRSTTKNGKYKKIKTLSKKSRSFTNKKLRKGKRYYYEARAYRKIDGKNYYGSFSAKKSIKVRR